jgi:hypothetical protein
VEATPAEMFVSARLTENMFDVIFSLKVIIYFIKCYCFYGLLSQSCISFGRDGGNAWGVTSPRSLSPYPFQVPQHYTERTLVQASRQLMYSSVLKWYRTLMFPTNFCHFLLLFLLLSF